MAHFTMDVGYPGLHVGSIQCFKQHAMLMAQAAVMKYGCWCRAYSSAAYQTLHSCKAPARTRTCSASLAASLRAHQRRCEAAFSGSGSADICCKGRGR